MACRAGSTTWSELAAVALCCAILAVAAPACAAAQRTKTLVIGVVADSGTANVVGADVQVLQGLTTVLARVKSDSAGFARLTFRPVGTTIQLSVRKIGFAPFAQFFDLGSQDSLATVVHLEQRVQALDTVRASAAEDPKHKSYYIDADAIVASGRPVFSALEILARLRPDMITSRAPEACADSTGPRPGQRTRHPPTGGIANVWVNGKRIRLVETSGWVKVPYMKESFVRREVLDILQEIHPEHVADIQYTDCFDTSVPVNGGQSAVFIRLKDGVEYERGKGTFVPAAKPPLR